MAAVLEVHLMLRKCPELWTIQRLIRGYGITTRSLVSMDSWQFDNPQPVEMPGPLTELLARHPILVAECAAAAFRAAGWHLERAGAEAIFTAWVDTFGHPQLDRDRITAENRSCYAAIYRSIALLARGAPGMFLAAGIGVETVFDYQGDLDRAHAAFNDALDPDLVDSAIYEIRAHQSRVNYLLRQIKRAETLEAVAVAAGEKRRWS